MSNIAGLRLNARGTSTTTKFSVVANSSEVTARTRFDMGANDTMRKKDRLVMLPARVDTVADPDRGRREAIRTSDTGCLQAWLIN